MKHLLKEKIREQAEQKKIISGEDQGKTSQCNNRAFFQNEHRKKASHYGRRAYLIMKYHQGRRSCAMVSLIIKVDILTERSALYNFVSYQTELSSVFR